MSLDFNNLAEFSPKHWQIGRKLAQKCSILAKNSYIWSLFSLYRKSEDPSASIDNGIEPKVAQWTQKAQKC